MKRATAIVSNKRMKRLITLTALSLATFGASAATDIAGVITDVTDYKDDAILVGIAIVLFIIGRKVVKKLI